MKVIGIGLNKTGTKTLGACMRYFGYRHMSFSEDAFRLWQSGDMDTLMGVAEQYDSFEDWPWPLVFRQMDNRFPGSKFVLTTRASPEIWYDSLVRHSNLTGPTIFRKAIYGSSMPQGSKEEHISYYNQHILDVCRYFRFRQNDLLKVCWEEGDGWDKLANFLGLPIPEIHFPHENQGNGQSLPILR